MIIDLLKYALENFYPRRKQEYDNKVYPCLEDKYHEWMNNTYTNGVWYMGEDIPEIVAFTNRSISNVFYIINTDNRDFLGFKLNKFKSNHPIKLQLKAKIDDDIFIFPPNDYYTVSFFENDNNYIYHALDTDLNVSNIIGVKVFADGIVDNHISYGNVELDEDNPILIPVSKSEYDYVRKNNIILQKLKTIPQIIRYSEMVYEDDTNMGDKVYGFRLKGFTPIVYSDEQIIDFSFKTYKDNVLQFDKDNPGYFSMDVNEDTLYVKDLDDVYESMLLDYDYVDGKTGIHHVSNGDFDKIIITITITGYGEYDGMMVKLTFENVSGNAYNDASDVEYYYNVSDVDEIK